MKTIIAIAATLFVAFAATNASAYLATPPMYVSACGSYIGICGGGGGGTSGGGGTTCESSSWGDSSTGGTQTACASDDGSGSWYTAEWTDSSFVFDKGSVSSDGSITTESGDYMAL